METLTEVGNDAGNPYILIIGQLLLEELKCIRKEIKEELRRITDKFQDYIEATKFSNMPSNFQLAKLSSANEVIDVEQTTNLNPNIKAEIPADVESGFPQNSIDLTECITDIGISQLSEVTPLIQKKSCDTTSFDASVKNVDCDNNKPDKSHSIGPLSETSSLKDKKLINGKRTRKSFPRKLKVNPEPSYVSDSEAVSDDEAAQVSSTDCNEDSEESWLQFVTIKKNFYFCNECQQNFSQRASLKRHCQIHFQEKLLKCDICFLSFQYSEDLESHKRDDHSVLPTNVEIKVNSSFKIHKFSGAAKSNRSLLNKSLSGSKKNGIHTITNQSVATQSQEKNFQEFKPARRRSNPNNKFILPPHHRKNVKIKNDRKFYHCDICFKTFVYTSQSYRRHMMIHTGERPYKCDFCNKGFIRAANLKMHVRIHTGEKPYKCHLCNKQFRMRSGLTTHLKSVHSTDADLVQWV